MTNVERIEKEIQGLTRAEREALREWALRESRGPFCDIGRGYDDALDAARLEALQP